ncbi:NAD(+) diphosphatase [Actinomycetospora sp. OC33-EN08]|uniref:NAD(+) diphosphatase n=1 Tax=Actinomycetospora aurantiaca TaxID=3129233 RepID=A0ABU8MJV4_9PSEU
MRAAFHLDSLPRLSRSTVDRREQVRGDPDHVAATWPLARVVRVDPQGRTPVSEQPDGSLRLVDSPARDFGDGIPDGAVLLGEEEGTAYWGVRVPDADSANDAGSGFSSTELWRDLRISGGELDARSAGLLTTAVALLSWHERARFCARDGSPMRAIKAGWAQLCEANDHEEYPRTDPSMICLVHDGADRVLLARQPIWPAGRYSVLAGFVEAGESLEACVARECAEEVGVSVSTITYLGSQPWPFPRSLMIGFSAVADPDESLRLQEGEIENARWVTRQELREALEAGDWMTREGEGSGARGVGGTAFEAGEDRDLILPGGVSIARAMLEAWAAAG